MTTAPVETQVPQQSPEGQPPPNQSQRDLIAALAVALAGAATVAAAVAAVLPLLLPLGLPRGGVVVLVTWVVRVPPARPTRTGRRPSGGAGPSATQRASRAVWAYRAAYLAAAAQRVADAVNRAQAAEGVSTDDALKAALKAERRYFTQHRQAEKARAAAADQVDAAAARYGPVLGWAAVLDEHTSRECRIADGGTFTAAAPPVIGYPGAVHPACRCRATAPLPGAPTVNAKLARAGL